MASQPQTWTVLQAIQYQLFTGLIVTDSQVTNASPFSTWLNTANPQNPGSVSDLTRFGTNPNGTVTTAIYVGMPKDYDITYPRQCHVIPPPQEAVMRHAFGGKVWDEAWVYIRLCYLNVNNWYENQQDLYTARDVLHPFIAHHAELPGADTVIATKEVAHASGMPTGYYRDSFVDREWDCLGIIWWARQEYQVTGGFVS